MVYRLWVVVWSYGLWFINCRLWFKAIGFGLLTVGYGLELCILFHRQWVMVYKSWGCGLELWVLVYRLGLWFGAMGHGL